MALDQVHPVQRANLRMQIIPEPRKSRTSPWWLPLAAPARWRLGQS